MSNTRAHKIVTLNPSQPLTCVVEVKKDGETTYCGNDAKYAHTFEFFAFGRWRLRVRPLCDTHCIRDTESLKKIGEYV
jgi:hypothetical protein